MKMMAKPATKSFNLKAVVTISKWSITDELQNFKVCNTNLKVAEVTSQLDVFLFDSAHFNAIIYMIDVVILPVSALPYKWARW